MKHISQQTPVTNEELANGAFSFHFPADITVGDPLTNPPTATRRMSADQIMKLLTSVPTAILTEIQSQVAALVGAAPGALDTIQELAAAMQNNPSIITALQSAIANKADISNITAINSTLDGHMIQLNDLYSRTNNIFPKTFTRLTGGSLNLTAGVRYLVDASSYGVYTLPHSSGLAVGSVVEMLVQRVPASPQFMHINSASGGIYLSGNYNSQLYIRPGDHYVFVLQNDGNWMVSRLAGQTDSLTFWAYGPDENIVLGEYRLLGTLPGNFRLNRAIFKAVLHPNSWAGQGYFMVQLYAGDSSGNKYPVFQSDTYCQDSSWTGVYQGYNDFSQLATPATDQGLMPSYFPLYAKVNSMDFMYQYPAVPKGLQITLDGRRNFEYP